MKALMILKDVENNYKNILIKYLMLNKYWIVKLFVILFNNQKNKHKNKNILKQWEKRKNKYEKKVLIKHFDYLIWLLYSLLIVSFIIDIFLELFS